MSSTLNFSTGNAFDKNFVRLEDSAYFMLFLNVPSGVSHVSLSFGEQSLPVLKVRMVPQRWSRQGVK
jgi:hypothetical protein